MTLRRVSSPAVLPVTVDEMKDHMRVDGDEENGLIEGLISAATSHLDGTGVLGHAMISQNWAQWFGNPPRWVRLRMGPFQEIVSVEYYDTDNEIQTADLSDFDTRLNGDFVEFGPKYNASWPSTYTRPDAIKVTYKAGYGDAETDVPENIRQAIFLTVAHWFENREAVSEGNFKELPMAVSMLVESVRTGWYG